MLRILSKTVHFSLILSFSFAMYAQNGSKELDMIVQKSKSIRSVEYTVHQKNAKGRYGRPIIKATIFQQKADVRNVGFGNAMMKAFGTIKERGVVKKFAFSYDGDIFLFEKGESGIKKYTKPTRKTVMGILQQFLFMLHIRSLSEKQPYLPKAKVFSPFKYLGTEELDGISYHKISSSIDRPMIMVRNGDTVVTKKVGRAADIFWIDKGSHFPVFYTDNFVYKTITVKQINKDYGKAYFTLNKNNTSVTSRNYQETQSDIYNKDLLKINSKTPEWSGISQEGKNFSSKSLLGKVVLIDFWGTWCPPCRKAMPDIEKLQQRYKGQKDVVIIGISVLEKKPNAAQDYFKSKGYTYVHIPNGDKIAKAFKVRVYPTLYILNKEGKIVQATIDYDIDDHERSKKIIDKYIKK